MIIIFFFFFFFLGGGGGGVIWYTMSNMQHNQCENCVYSEHRLFFILCMYIVWLISYK